MEGLLDEVTGMERLRASCELRRTESGGNHDDHMFCEGWSEGNAVKQEASEGVELTVTTPTIIQTEKTNNLRNKKQQMGF